MQSKPRQSNPRPDRPDIEDRSWRELVETFEQLTIEDRAVFRPVVTVKVREGLL